MSEGSCVNLAWGVQIESMPLLLAIEAYERSEPARLFFSLLHLRAHSSTLVFTSPSSFARLTIASLPPEIIDEVLDQLFLSLLPDAKRTMVEKVGKCGCQREFATEHTCGVDCPSWFYCCGYPEGTVEVRDEDRSERFSTNLTSTYNRKIETVSQLFFLDLVNPPLAEQDFYSIRYGELLPSVVGIPFVSRPPHHNPSQPKSTSYIEQGEPHGHWDDLRVTSVAAILELTEGERSRFRAFARALRLEEAAARKEDPLSVVSKASLLDGVLEEKGRTERKMEVEGEKEGGKTSLEPKLMLVHRSWAHVF